MNAVVEGGDVRQIVHADPPQRAIVAEARAYRLEKRGVGEQDRMTVHTGLCLIQVLVGGIPANADVSTEVWQYRQSIPRQPRDASD